MPTIFLWIVWEGCLAGLGKQHRVFCGEDSWHLKKINKVSEKSKRSFHKFGVVPSKTQPTATLRTESGNRSLFGRGNPPDAEAHLHTSLQENPLMLLAMLCEYSHWPQCLPSSACTCCEVLRLLNGGLREASTGSFWANLLLFAVWPCDWPWPRRAWAPGAAGRWSTPGPPGCTLPGGSQPRSRALPASPPHPTLQPCKQWPSLHSTSMSLYYPRIRLHVFLPKMWLQICGLLVH